MSVPLLFVGRSFARRAAARIATSVTVLPPDWRPTLIVALGCPPLSRSGAPSRFLIGRAEAAAAAHHALGGPTILCSGRVRGGTAARHPGDPTTTASGRGPIEDEPEALAALIERANVPPDRIARDREALRTLDSIDFLVRHHGHERILLVSQAYHLPRVLHLARARGLDAFGLVAPGPAPGRRERLREALGRLRALFDVGFGPRGR